MNKKPTVTCGLGLLALLIWSITLTAATPVVELVSVDPAFTNPFTITTDGTSLFVVNFVSADNNNIVSLPITGGAVTTLHTNLRSPLGMAVIGTELFWIDPNSGPITDTQILKSPKIGGPITPIYTGSLVGQPIVDGSGLTSVGTKLFSVDEVQGRVHSLNADGSGLTLLGVRFGGFFDTERFQQIDESDGTLYISDVGRAGVAPPGVFSIPQTGGPFSTLHEGAPFICPTTIAVAGPRIFVADPCANTIWTLPTGGGVPSVYYSGAPFLNVWGLVHHGDALYATDLGDPPGGEGPGAIYKITEVILIVIDIKPGSDPNSINPSSQGVIPVAVLTTEEFDASTVDVQTVRFGPTGTEAAPVHSDLYDVDGDGDVDLILQFRTQDTGIACGDNQGLLTGATQLGDPILGSDPVRTVPCP